MIYAVRAVGTDFIKIGRTGELNARDRLHMLQTGCPFELELIAVGEGGRVEEQRLHLSLRAARAHHMREWFKDCEAVQKAIRWIADRRKVFPEPPPLKDQRHRLARVKEYADLIENHGCQPPDSPAPKPSPSVTAPATEVAHQFMQSLLTWESSNIGCGTRPKGVLSRSGDTPVVPYQ